MKIRAFLFSLLLPIFSFAVNAPWGRHSNAPILSGDAFRSYADYVFDELDSSLNPFTIKPRSTIFVKTDMLGLFFQKIHPNINVPYIIISHNSDDACPGPYHAYLDDEKLIAWFGQNYDGYPHPKMHPIPIGIANFCWPHGNADTLNKVKGKNLPRIHLAHMNFTIQTFYPERWGVFKHFCHENYCFRTMKKPFEGFLNDLASSKFSISPRGFGLDTHRFWESLYLGTIPVVKTSSLDGLYSGLPALIINDWNAVTEESLEKKYDEIKAQTYNMEKIYTDYWFRLIDSYKKEN